MLVVNWWKKLSWKIKIGWSKNAALPIMAAALLIKWKVTLKNVPEIQDVFTYLDILEGIWVEYSFSKNILTLDSTNLKNTNFDLEKIKKIRVSVLLLAPLLDRLWNVSIPTPWGCNLWARSIFSHLKWLENIGYKYEYKQDENNQDLVYLSGKSKGWDLVIDAWFWVTPTENLIVANVLRNGKTTIKLSAIEPHVLNLVDFLRTAWAEIFIRYDHTIIINGVSDLKNDFEFDVVSDYIQSWTYIIIWALASKEYIDIENARIDDLYSFLEKIRESWVKFEDLWNDVLRVYKAEKIKATNIQTNIFPGFPTDLQSPFAVLQTQAEWISRIHEILFEWRLNWLVELETMWLNMSILNPHQAHISWKCKFIWGKSVTSWDLRAGASMIIAWLITDWTTKIEKVEYIHRWYEDIVKNLTNLWADIEEID
jgi:UDP-N-acetylglucosamine 1-carboxyvinyltransferase